MTLINYINLFMGLYSSYLDIQNCESTVYLSFYLICFDWYTDSTGCFEEQIVKN